MLCERLELCSLLHEPLSPVKTDDHETEAGLTVVHEEEAEADVVEDEVHPVPESDGLLHRFPDAGKSNW